MAKELDPSQYLLPTQRELAFVLGIDPRTLRNWTDSGCECESSAGWSIRHAIEWARQNVWATRLPTTGEGGDRREAAELEKLEAQATIARTKSEQLLGMLVDREAVEAALRTLLNSIRHRLQACPDEIAGVIPPEFRADVAFDMATKVDLILTEMSAWADSDERYGGRGMVDEPGEIEMERGVDDVTE